MKEIMTKALLTTAILSCILVAGCQLQPGYRECDKIPPEYQLVKVPGPREPLTRSEKVIYTLALPLCVLRPF